MRATIPRPNESSERGEIRASPAARSNKLSALPKGHSWSGKLRPVLVMHSEDDQIVPYVAAGPSSAKLLKNGTLKNPSDSSQSAGGNPWLAATLGEGNLEMIARKNEPKLTGLTSWSSPFKPCAGFLYEARSEA